MGYISISSTTWLDLIHTRLDLIHQFKLIKANKYYVQAEGWQHVSATDYRVGRSQLSIYTDIFGGTAMFRAWHQVI
jgi:hypothetical protein